MKANSTTNMIPDLECVESGITIEAAPSEKQIVNLDRMEEDGNKEDICDQTKGALSDECVMNKKLMRCLKHDCGLRSMNVSSRRWQWSEKKQQYGNVTRKVKKYVCVSVGSNVPVYEVNQVQLRVTREDGPGKQTKSESEHEVKPGNELETGTTTIWAGLDGSGRFESESQVPD